MFQPKFAKHITKQKDWGKKQRKYRTRKGSYKTLLNKYQEDYASNS